MHCTSTGLGSSPVLTSQAGSSGGFGQTSFLGMTSRCSGMQRIFSLVEKVARSDSTVLILGESGTGKELVAKALHKLSGRQGRLVPVNCAAIPEEILESELFGHEKGAFTGAIASRAGRFQLADQGTIFLDEIAEMSPKLQAKLLRVLQERRIEPVGSTRFIDVDVRIVAATNRNLVEEVKAGRFRADLFYRLQVVPMELPPLRERGKDVLLLADHFIARCCDKLALPLKVFTQEVRECLLSYPWPGNVRELENLIERLVLLTEKEAIGVDEMPEYFNDSEGQICLVEVDTDIPANGVDFNSLVDRYEIQLISTALARTNWNKKAAAKLLGLNRTTLVEKIKKKGLERRIEVIVERDREGRESDMVNLFRAQGGM